jgi:hypothetical protein
MSGVFIFDDAAKLQKLIDEYFEVTPEEEWTVTGLCMTLECDRDTLLNYEKEAKEREEKGIDPEVIRLIKKAKMKVHNAYERDLRKKARPGDIFGLKNFGWKDQNSVDHTTGGEPFKVDVISFKPKE